MILAAVTHSHHWELSWFTHFFGMDNLSGPFYGAWSGWLSDVAEYTVALTLIGGLYHTLRKHNCGVQGCWRIGLRPVHGTEHSVCHRHHPRDRATAESIAADHQAAHPELYEQ